MFGNLVKFKVYSRVNASSLGIYVRHCTTKPPKDEKSNSIMTKIKSTFVGEPKEPPPTTSSAIDTKKDDAAATTTTVKQLHFKEGDPFALFFEEEDNWAKSTVITGRSWRLEELRIKSNVDLHKLWYVLLIERNMLETMYHAYKRADRQMTNPERYYKVLESMQHLEQVVGERNRAFIELETGETGERPTKTYTTWLGFRDKKYLREHSTPSTPDDKVYEEPYLNDDVRMFQKIHKEKMWERARNKEDDEKRLAGKHRKVYQY